MRIGIDARLIEGEHFCGIKTYTQNLISHLAKIDKRNQYFIFSPKPTYFPPQKNFKLKIIKTPLPPPRSVFYTQILLPLVIRQEKLDIIHFLNNTAPLLPLGGVKSVLTLHDIIDLLPLPVASTLRFKNLHYYQKLIIPRNAKKVDFIITPSFESKKSIVKTLGINESKIKVVYEGIGRAFRRLPQPEINNFKKKEKLDKFFLSLGSFSPRKNLIGVLTAFSRLPAKLRQEYKLAIILSFSTLKSSLLEQISKLNLRDSVIFFESPLDEELALFYNAATALIFPSLYEGFGLPALEAMACGTPVIASNLSSFPEIVGKAAILVDPKNTKEITEAMVRIAKWLEDDTGKYQELVEKGFRQVKKFSWREAARKTLAVYKEAYEKKNLSL